MCAPSIGLLRLCHLQPVHQITTQADQDNFVVIQVSTTIFSTLSYFLEGHGWVVKLKPQLARAGLGGTSSYCSSSGLLSHYMIETWKDCAWATLTWNSKEIMITVTTYSPYLEAQTITISRSIFLYPPVTVSSNSFSKHPLEFKIKPQGKRFCSRCKIEAC